MATFFKLGHADLSNANVPQHAVCERLLHEMLFLLRVARGRNA